MVPVFLGLVVPGIAISVRQSRRRTFSRYLATRKFILLWLALYGAFMVASNQRLTILDDEGTIVTVANQSASAAIGAFTHGSGQHEHPPLSDIVLHAWLVVTHHSFAWLRVSANAFFIIGLLILSECGRKLSGVRTQYLVVMLGSLWPFGYFYARIAGWYCFCFMLVALLTHGYLCLLQKPSPPHWAYFSGVAVMLLWSNYFGVVILAVLLIDLVLFHRGFLRSHAVGLLIAGGLIVLSFLPLLHALLSDAGTARSGPTPLLVSLMKIGYMFFALLASVALAPWFLPWGLPVAVACLLLLSALVRETFARRYTLYFLLLMIVLAISNHLDLKRLLFLTPWMLLAIALACTRGPDSSRWIGAGAVAVIFTVGWIGIATGRHPATVNFYEPWKSVAAVTADRAKEGDTILSNSTPYFFYLNYALGLENQRAAGTFLGSAMYRSHGYSIFRDTMPAPPTGNITVVEGVEASSKGDAMARSLDAIRQSCRLLASERSTPDPAIQFKKLLSPVIPIRPYRVTVERFDCSAER